MHPKTYIIQVRKITITKAANELGYSRVHLTEVLNHRCVPGLKLCEKIPSWANEQVTFTEMMELRRSIINQLKIQPYEQATGRAVTKEQLIWPDEAA